MLKFFVDDLLLFAETSSHSHLLFEDPRENSSGLVWLRETVASDQLLQQGHILVLFTTARQVLIEEFNPEFDLLGLGDLPLLEDAVQVEVALPVDDDVVVVHIEALCCEDALVDFRVTARQKYTVFDKVVNRYAVDL